VEILLPISVTLLRFDGTGSTPTKPHVSCSNEEQPRRWSSRSPVDPGQQRIQLARLLAPGEGLAIEPEIPELISTYEAVLGLGQDHASTIGFRVALSPHGTQLNVVLGTSAVTGVTERRRSCV
jgi:hypothetical protein